MKTPSDLRLLTLAVIQQEPTEGKTRYHIMTKINHLVSDLVPPYSPGAVYHELKLLEKDKMIVINQSSHVDITEQGLELLRQILLESPTPGPLLSLVIRTVVLLLLNDRTNKKTGLHKLQIEMIKYGQLLAENERQGKTNRQSPKTEIELLRQSLRKAVSSFVAQL